MIVSLVCPGPTAAGRMPALPAGLVIAVNRSAEHVAADFWCFGDVETWHLVIPLGCPRWAVNDNVAFRIRHEHRGHVPECAVFWESLVGPAHCNWNIYSATAALVLAQHLGATRIHCFGVVDEFAIDGESPRWPVERRIWNSVVEWLGWFGIPVVREPVRAPAPS